MASWHALVPKEGATSWPGEHEKAVGDDRLDNGLLQSSFSALSTIYSYQVGISCEQCYAYEAIDHM